MKRSSILLLVALVLDIALYFPLMTSQNTRTAIEDSIRGSPLSLAVQNPVIVYLTLNTTTIVVPVLFDFLTDSFILGLRRASIERSLLIFSVFCTSLAQLISLHTKLAATFYGISLYAYLWLLFSIGFIVLNRLCPKAFTIVRVINYLLIIYLHIFHSRMFLSDVSKYKESYSPYCNS